MKKIISTILSIILISFSITCTYAKNLSGLELRQLQTRVYDTSDTQKVIKAVANTLQDSNFIIEEVEPEIGYLRARKTFKKQYINKGRFAGQSFLLALFTSYAVFTWGSTAGYMYAPTRKLTDELHKKNVVVDTNVNIEPFGYNKTKVRIVLVQKVLQNAEGFSYCKNAPLRASRINNPKIYEEFFNQLESHIFY